jgi:hypothetical protein
VANELVLGNWHQGLDRHMAQQVDTLVKRKRSGARMFPHEAAMMALVNMLNEYDKWYMANSAPTTPPDMTLDEFKQAVKAIKGNARKS